MKHTEQEVLEKSKIILKDIRQKYYSDNSIDGILFEAKDEILMGPDKGEIKQTWLVYIKSLFDNIDVLTISDETGEPLYYQNFNLRMNSIEKNSEGRYFLIID